MTCIVLRYIVLCIIWRQAGEAPRIVLRGYLVGNGCTDPVFDGNALVAVVVIIVVIIITANI